MSSIVLYDINPDEPIKFSISRALEVVPVDIENAKWLSEQDSLAEAWETTSRADWMISLHSHVQYEYMHIKHPIINEPPFLDDNEKRMLRVLEFRDKVSTNIANIFDASGLGRKLYKLLFGGYYTERDGVDYTYRSYIHKFAPSVFHVNLIDENISHHSLDRRHIARDYFLPNVYASDSNADKQIFHSVVQNNNFETLNYLASGKALNLLNLPYVDTKDKESLNNYYTLMLEEHKIQADLIRLVVPSISDWAD